MRIVAVCALLSGCTPIGKGNCVEDQYYVGPSVALTAVGSNSDHLLVGWSRTEDSVTRFHSALFDAGGGRIAGSEFSMDGSYRPAVYVGAPDRALVTGYINTATDRSFYAIQLASGEVLTPVEPATPIHGGVYEGPGFLVATDHGVARISLDGVLTDMDLSRRVAFLIAGATVTWAISVDAGKLSGVRIAHNGGVLDAPPRPIADVTGNQVLSASRGDEMVIGSLYKGVLTWSVLAADGTVNTSTAMTEGTTVSTDASVTSYGTALVADNGGYLMFVEAQLPNEIGSLSITSLGVPAPLVPVTNGSGTKATSFAGHTMAVFNRDTVYGTTAPAIDAIVVGDGATPIALEEPTGGHIEQRECGVL